MNLLNLVLPWWVKPLAILLAVASVYGLGRLHQAQDDEQERDKAQLHAWQQGDEHVASYIKKANELGDVRDTADRLNRMCLSRAPVHRPERAPRAPGTNPLDRRVDPQADGDPTGDPGPSSEMTQLAGELHSTQRNRFKCEALQATVKPQAKKEGPWWDPRSWGD